MLREGEYCYEIVSTTYDRLCKDRLSNRRRIGRISQTRRHKCGCCNIEFYSAGRASWLINLNCDILAFHLGTMHCLLRLDGIFFIPEFYDTRIGPKLSLSIRRGEGAKRAEEVIQLRIGEL